jgi:hypothetical protein
MSWLKSPWFWLALLVAGLLVYLLFFRPSSPVGKTTGGTWAPQNMGTGASYRGLLDSIEADFSIGGGSIMGGVGGDPEKQHATIRG